MASIRSLLGLALALLGGCGLVTDPGAGPGAPLDSLPRALSATEGRLIAGSNAFAFALLREVDRVDPAPNLFLSPLSASLALGMTTNGARGPTQTAMRSTLGFGDAPMEAVNGAYRELIDLLRGLDPAVEVRIANSVWMREGYPFAPVFLETTRAYFDAEAAELDFGSPDAVRRINEWVRRGTEGKIDEIVRRIPGNVVMYLLNAVYFKGDWTQRFDRRATADAPFTLADGSTRTVKMMHLRDGEVRAAEVEGARAVELPYGRGAYVMTVVLPAEGVSVERLVAEMDARRWERLTGALSDARMDVRLPRFRLEYEQTLNDPLGAMGMGIAFGAGADFSGLSPRGAGLYISEVKQKTFVEVNEEGTEAAAVTSVAVAESMPPTFTVDRPFLVAIRERFSGAILFLGVVGEPGE